MTAEETLTIDEMSHEEMIDTLKGLVFGTFDRTTAKERDALVMVIKVLEQSRWIPTAERMPDEEEKPYWVCTDGGYQCECRWTNANPIFTHLTIDWHWNIFDIPQYSKVIAWRELPEPYKAESEDIK